MPYIDPNQTVTEILEKNPQAVLVLDRFHVDYGFAGALTLTEACLKQGLNLQELLAQLGDADREESFLDEKVLEGFEVPELVHYFLANTHDFLGKELSRLQELFQQALATCGDRHPELLEWLAFFKRFRESLEGHMRKQGKKLFPLFLLAAGSPAKAGVKEVARQILDFHKTDEKLRKDLVFLRKETEGFQVPPDADRTLRDLVFDLEHLEAEVRRHLRLESELLFPKALEKSKAGPDL